MRLITIGLTGGIATGKSAVAELWRARASTVIDCDELAHRTLEPGTPTHDEILERFGTVERRALAAIVFSDERRRQELNGLIHPAVYEMWKRELAGRTGIAVVAVPLLFEVGAEGEFDWTVAVGCSEQTQLARLRAKGLDESQARARIRAQWPLQRKLDCADYVIWNDGTRAVLARQAEMIWDKLKEN